MERVWLWPKHPRRQDFGRPQNESGPSQPDSISAPDPVFLAAPDPDLFGAPPTSHPDLIDPPHRELVEGLYRSYRNF